MQFFSTFTSLLVLLNEEFWIHLSVLQTFLFSYKIFILNSYANTIFLSIAVFVFRLNLFKKKFKDFYSFDVKNSSFQSLNLLMMRKLKKVIKTLTIFCIFNFLLLYLHNLFDNLTNYGFVAITFLVLVFYFVIFRHTI